MLIGAPSSMVPMSRALFSLIARPRARSCSVSFVRLAGDEGGEAFGHFLLGHGEVAVCGDGRDRRVDAAHDVRSPGGGVLVGRLVEGLDGELESGGPVDVLAPPQLDSGPGVTA